MSCSALKSLVLLCLALQAATNVDGGISTIPNASIVPTATRKVAAKSVCPKPSTTTKTITNTATSFVTIRPPATTTVTTRITTTIKPTPATTTVTSRTTTTIRPTPSTTTLTSRTTTTIRPAPVTTTLTSTIIPTPVTTTVTTTIQPSCSTTPDPMSSTEPSSPSESTTLESSTETSTSDSVIPIGCESVATIVDTSNGGYSVNLRVPFSQDTANWALQIQFSGCFSCFTFLSDVPYNIETAPGSSVLIISHSSPQSAGNVLTIPGKIVQSNANAPSITAMSLNGQDICGTSSMVKRDVNVTRSSPNQRSIGSCTGCSCAFDEQCNCKYLQAQTMTCNSLVKSKMVLFGTWIFDLTLPFSGPVNSWTATVTFSTAIGSLSDGDATVFGTPAHGITQGPTEFQISNIAADAVQCAGSAVTVSLEAEGVSSETAVTAVTVNGQTVCTGGARINQREMKRP